jgi:hypothetical protein
MPLSSLHTQEELYLRNQLYEACGGEKKRKVDVPKVRNILGNFPELANDDIGVSVKVFYPYVSSCLVFIRFIL